MKTNFPIRFVGTLLAATVLAGLFLPPVAHAQPVTGAVESRVFNAATATALVNARVKLPALGREAITDETGTFRLAGVPEGTDGFLQHSLTFDGDTAFVFYGGGSRHDTQDGKDLRLLRLHRDFFTSRVPWPCDWRGRPVGAPGATR